MAIEGDTTHYKRDCSVIYGLFDPDGECRYVGKSTWLTARLALHRKMVRNERYQNYRERWIRTLWAQGQDFQVRVLEAVSNETASEREVLWIAKLKEEGNRLTNETRGGEGIVDPTGSIGQKISKALTGRKLSPEHRAKVIKNLCRGYPLTPEHIAARRDAGRKGALKRWGKESAPVLSEVR